MQGPRIRELQGVIRIGLVVCIWIAAMLAFYLTLGPNGLGLATACAGPGACLLAFGSSWLGWVVRQAWLYPKRLRKVEALWAAGGYASDVVDALAGIHLATGELGYRVWLLRSKANLALGFRNLAWVESEEAHLARVPFWWRPFLRRSLRALPRVNRKSLDATGRIWLRLTPDMPSLLWRLAIEYLRQDQPDNRNRAWELLLRALPHANEDPVLLEDLLLALLGRLQEQVPDAGALGRQPGEPECQAAFERVLDQLVHRHGTARLGWDRVSPAMHLLRQGRLADVLAIGKTLPPDQYSEPLWVAVVVAHKGLGDLDGAWSALGQALTHQPESFRLWMMKEDLALELHRNSEALAALEHARTLFTNFDGAPMEQLREWHTRRAEYAYWIEKDTAEAAKHLDFMPAIEDSEGHAPLRLLILLDLARYEEVHRELEPLLARRPDDVDLQLLQAESLGGMEAWESLQKLLDTMVPESRQHADFWHLRGICRSHLGNLQGAREDLERSFQMEPDNLGYGLDAGHACADLGEWERSEFHWRQVLRQDERNEEALTQLAEVRRTLHDDEGARRLLRECLNHHPESQTAQGMLAELEAN
jgi:tetratricopeptide (TPR) repeat protein